MISRTLVSDLAAHVDQKVTVCGWIDTSRLQRRIQFVLVRDHSGVVQVTNKRSEPASEVEEILESTPIESAVVVTGTVVANPAVKVGGVEIVPDSVVVANAAEPSLPINALSGIEHRLDWRFLDLRRPAHHLVFEVTTTLEEGLREFAYRHGAIELHTPKLMGTPSESGAEVFKLGYFGGNAYLAQSPQFYKQMAISGGMDLVFEIGDVFRAEPSFTSRHATEFTSIDVEIAWIEDVEDVMAFEERMLAHAIGLVARRHGAAISDLLGVDLVVPEVPFPRITMAQAQEHLRAQGWTPEKDKGDLDPAGERMVSEWIANEHGHEFVFVRDYPIGVRPFYHLRPAHDPSVTASFDLLWRGTEITTGAQREHRPDVLVAQAVEKGLDPEPLRPYLDSFRYGTPPHGGLGAGLARIVMVALGLDSIRESTFLFRGPNRLAP